MPKFMSLKILDVFRPLFRMSGIDYTVMRKILGMKLLMDQRRPPAILSGSNVKEKGNLFLKSLALYAIYGLILIPFIFIGDSLMFQMSIVFGVGMFILMTTMVSDFSNVLLDLRDKTILHTKPISSRTISAAKTMHIAIYMSMLTGAFAAIPSLVVLGVHGILPFLLFVVMLVLIALLIIALTALVYIFVLRFFSGERLRDIINYMQIILAIGIIVGYQVLIRAFDIEGMDYLYTFSWWHILMPPMWFGAPFEMFFHADFSAGIIGLASMGLVAPLLAIGLYYYLMPSFERNLQKLMEEAAVGKKKKKRLENLWAKVVCHQKEERVFFHFASSMLRYEREFKLKVYPVLGMACVFPFIFMLNTLTVGGTYEDISVGGSYYSIYFSAIMIATAVHALGSSANYKGSWIFQAAPIHNHRSIYSAALKALFVKLYVPVFLFLSVVFLWIFSWRIIPDLLIALVSVILCTLIAHKMFSKNEYPFSEPFASMQEGGSTVVYFLFMFVVGAFALVHLMISFIPGDIVMYVYLAALSGITFFSWSSAFRKRVPLQPDPPENAYK